MIAEGDYVAARWIGGGTHSGRAFDDLNTGKLDQPNTGKKIWFSGITIFTLKDGKIKEEIAEEDGLQVLQQLGLVPGPNPGKEKKYNSKGDQIY
jgi:predicted ester cyclase